MCRQKHTRASLGHKVELYSGPDRGAISSGQSGPILSGNVRQILRLCPHSNIQTEDDPNHEWLDINADVRYQNWESMASIDWSALVQSVGTLLEESRTSGTALIIIEGHLIFNFK